MRDVKTRTRGSIPLHHDGERCDGAQRPRVFVANDGTYIERSCAYARCGFTPARARGVRGSRGWMIQRPTHGLFFDTVVVDRPSDRSFRSVRSVCSSGGRAGDCVATRAWIGCVVVLDARRARWCAGTTGAGDGSMELGSGVVDKKRARGLARAIHLSVGCFYRRMDGGDAWERKDDTIPEMHSR